MIIPATSYHSRFLELFVSLEVVLKRMMAMQTMQLLFGIHLLMDMLACVDGADEGEGVMMMLRHGS